MVIVGFMYVLYVYLYLLVVLCNFGLDVEEVVCVMGVCLFCVVFDVSLLMMMFVLLFVGVLVFFFGFEVFGLLFVFGDLEGYFVFVIYLYKLINKFGVLLYYLMVVVVVCIVVIMFLFVLL